MSLDKNKEECELAVKKTLAYRSIFKYPLSVYQLKTFLVAPKSFRNKTIVDALEHLLDRGYIKEKNEKYYLPGVKISDWEQKKKLTQKFLNRNSSVLKTLGKIPWVNMIAVTGSVAASNPNEDSDIDVLVVSARNRVWMTRLFCTVVLKILKKFPNKDGEKGKICTNLYMDSGNLSWEKEKRNLYIAHDIALMLPVVDKNNTYCKFLYENRWISEFLPNFQINKPSVTKKKRNLSSPAIDFLEKIFMTIQIRHMRSKLTTETILNNLIHFNKNDNCVKILDAYEKVLINRRIS